MGGCVHKQSFAALEAIHCRAASLIYRLPKDTPSTNEGQLAHWVKLSEIYKARLGILIVKSKFSVSTTMY